MKILYKIEPADPSTIAFELQGDQMSGLFMIIVFLAGAGQLILIPVALIFGGFLWLWALAIGAAAYVLMLIFSKLEHDSTYGDRKKIAIAQAETYSRQLNNILEKSHEIVERILPHFEASAINNLKIANVDFADNALYPFWERIEETCKDLGCYKEAVDQLVVNGEIYSKVLIGKRHNFPTPFPIGTNVSISQNVLDDFNFIVREAHRKPDFANIYGHYKTHKILIAGFQTLAEAINNMKDAIVSAISSLKHSIKSDFRELKNIQIEQLKSYETSQAAINNTLTSMDKKLYYMEYHKKPTTPFIRPFND